MSRLVNEKGEPITDTALVNCSDCAHRYRLENWHYHEAWNKGKYGMEVKHTEMNGFICDIFANEGTMVWLTGECGVGGCEMYERREE